MSIDIRKRLGAFPSPKDPRHFRVRHPSRAEVLTLPPTYDGLYEFHRSEWYDQGDIGSCVGWCGMIAMEVTNHLLDLVPEDLSAGWLYSRSRYYANIPEWQEGSTNLGLMKALNHEGAVTEGCCHSDNVAPFECNPCENAYEIAKSYAIDSYWYVDPFPNDFKAAIYGITHPTPYKMPDGSDGKLPLVTAYPVYSSYSEGYGNGIVPSPQPGEDLLGGHSSVVRGWTQIDGKDYFINSNSWGKDVGDNGTFYLPVDYPFYEGWIIHNGPYTPPPEPTPSPCLIGTASAKVFSVLPWMAGRKGRYYYMNPP